MPEPLTVKAAGGKLEIFRGTESLGTIDAPAPVPAEEAFAQLLTDIGLGGRSADELKALLAAGERAVRKEAAEASRKILLDEVIVAGRVDTTKAADYLPKGKISSEDFKAALNAQERVDRVIAQGRLLPRLRGQATRLCLSDPETFKSLVEEGRPVLNLNPQGLAGEGATGDPTKDLPALARARAKEKNISYGAALSEISREHPQLAADYRARVTAGKE